MTKSLFSTGTLTAAATAALLSFGIAGTAQAQGQDSGWFWGGGSTIGGSGREVFLHDGDSTRPIDTGTAANKERRHKRDDRRDHL